MVNSCGRTDGDSNPPGARRCGDVESTSTTLIRRRRNVVCPAGWLHVPLLISTVDHRESAGSRLAKWQIRPCLPRWGGQGLRGELFYLYLHWAFPNTCIFIRSKQGLRWATSYAVLSLYNIYLYLYIYIYIYIYVFVKRLYTIQSKPTVQTNVKMCRHVLY